VYLPDSFEPLALQVGMLAQSPSPVGMGEVGGEGRGEGLAALAQARATALVTEGIDQGVGRNGERSNQRYGSQPQDTAYSAYAPLDTQRPVTALHSGEYVERSALASASASLSLYWYQNDPNGCPIRLLSSTGEVLWAASYTAWADLDLLHTAAIDNPIRLQGQYADAETGLYYNRHRYFCPHAGQFVSQDPLRLAGGDNLFELASNISYWTDPLGLSCIKANRAQGKAAEQAILARLRKNPNVTVLAEQVMVNTPTGRRYIDILFRNNKTGAIVALEVKSGGARYAGSQVTKDAAIAAGNATFSMGEKAVQAGVAGQATTGVITALKRVP
jgi:RHS repeat-associated protein